MINLEYLYGNIYFGNIVFVFSFFVFGGSIEEGERERCAHHFEHVC